PPSIAQRCRASTRSTHNPSKGGRGLVHTRKLFEGCAELPLAVALAHPKILEQLGDLTLASHGVRNRGLLRARDRQRATDEVLGHAETRFGVRGSGRLAGFCLTRKLVSRVA